jgi:hypothetical protein
MPGHPQKVALDMAGGIVPILLSQSHIILSREEYPTDAPAEMRGHWLQAPLGSVAENVARADLIAESARAVRL